MFSRRLRPSGNSGVSPDAAAVRGRVEEQGVALDADQLRTLARLEAAGSRSLYLWGGVGRGKSWLLAEYFALLPEPAKRRLHFHAFLGGLHTALVADPAHAEQVLSGYCAESRVLLFDEFHLHDVADAHLLNRWLPRALAGGLRILATSNYPPQHLLPDPLFHEAALPTIRAIESVFHVIELTGSRDYRSLSTDGGNPLSGWTHDRSAVEVPRSAQSVPLGRGSRQLAVEVSDDGTLVAPFSRLCEEPLSVQDHLVLARRWRRWFVTEVPAVDTMHRESVQRWANLVDVLYDERVDVVFQGEDVLPTGSALTDRVRDAPRFASRLHHLARRPFLNSQNS